jgi:hypothetical protein
MQIKRAPRPALPKPAEPGHGDPTGSTG